METFDCQKCPGQGTHKLYQAASDNYYYFCSDCKARYGHYPDVVFLSEGKNELTEEEKQKEKEKWSKGYPGYNWDTKQWDTTN